MLIFSVAVSVIAVMVFIEWQYSVMSERLRVRKEARAKSRPTRRTRRH
jgi:hypothetical protein